MFEDGFNCWWKECTTFRRWLTFDESRVAGWYHPITQGPDPKPIRTGTTIHSLAITHGDLASYKLHVRMFGGATDGDLDKTNENTVTTQKWVNLLSLMLASFKRAGHCVTMDSAYMGDIMAMIGRDVWRINIVIKSASKPYRRQRRLHEVDEEGNVWRRLLAAYMSITLFRRVVRQHTRQNAV
jgi:hypothetical protein